MPVLGDGYYFHEVAKLVAHGQAWLSPGELLSGKHYVSAEHPPLYTLLLAGLDKLGVTSYDGQRVVGGLLGTGSVVVVGLLGRRVAGDGVALLAALIAALYPTLVAADGALMSETLLGLLVALALLTALRAIDDPRPSRLATLGALIGLAALTRSESLLLLPLLGLPVAVRAVPRRRLRAALVVTAATVVVIAPWTIRNWGAFGQLVPISNNGGTTIAGANCARTYGGHDLGYFVTDCIRVKRRSNEADDSARMRRKGLDYAGDHVGRLPLVGAVRFMRSWGLYQPLRQGSEAEGRLRRVQLAGAAVYYALVLLAIYGALAIRRRRRAQLLVLLAPFAVVSITALLTYGSLRLRHAAELPLVVLAAVGLAQLWGNLRARRRRGPVEEPTGAA